jgi:hypothetical protein
MLMQLLQLHRDLAAVKRQERQQQRRQQQQQRGVPGKRSARAAAAAAMGGAAAKRAKGFSLSSVSIRTSEKNHAFCDWCRWDLIEVASQCSVSCTNLVGCFAGCRMSICV